MPSSNTLNPSSENPNCVPPQSHFSHNLQNSAAMAPSNQPLSQPASFTSASTTTPLGSNLNTTNGSPSNNLMPQSPPALAESNYFKSNSPDTPIIPKPNERSYSFSSFIFTPSGAATKAPPSGSVNTIPTTTITTSTFTQQSQISTSTSLTSSNISTHGTRSNSLQNPHSIPNLSTSINNSTSFGISSSMNHLNSPPPLGNAVGSDFMFPKGNPANSASKFRSVLSASFSGSSSTRDRDIPNSIGFNSTTKEGGSNILNTDDNSLFTKRFSIISPRDSTLRSDLSSSGFSLIHSPNDDDKKGDESDDDEEEDDDDFINNPGVISASQLLFDDDPPIESDTIAEYRNSASNILTNSSPSLTNMSDSLFRSASITLLNNLQNTNQSSQQQQQIHQQQQQHQQQIQQQLQQPRQNRSVSAAVFQAETTDDKFPILVRRRSSVSYANDPPSVGFPSRSRNNSTIFNLDSIDAGPLQANPNRRVSSAAVTRGTGSSNIQGSELSPELRASEFFKISGMSSYDMSGRNSNEDKSSNITVSTTSMTTLGSISNNDQDNNRKLNDHSTGIQYSQSFTELSRVGSQNPMSQSQPNMAMLNNNNNYMQYQLPSQMGGVQTGAINNGEINSLNMSMSPMNMAMNPNINPMNMNPMNMNPMNMNMNMNVMNMNPVNMNPMTMNPMNMNPMNMNPMNMEMHINHPYGNNGGHMNSFMMNGMQMYNPNMNPTLMHPSYGGMYNNVPPTGGPMGSNSNNQELGSRGNGDKNINANNNNGKNSNNNNNNNNNNNSNNNNNNNDNFTANNGDSSFRNNGNNSNNSYNNSNNSNNSYNNSNNSNKNHKNDRSDNKTNEDNNNNSETNTKHKKNQSNETNTNVSGTETRRQNEQEIAQRFANMELETMTKEIYSLCKDQHGCRFLQKKLEDKDPKYLDLIFNQTYPHVVELMTDPFGNYLCQKLLEHVTVDQRTILVKTAAPELVKIALNQHGTRALQKMIEFVTTPEQISIIVKALNTNVVKLIEDLNGNHVIQKCLNRLSSNDSQFIFDAVAENCVAVGTHRHGCCVLQRCIDHASTKQKSQLINEITKNSFGLVQDPFGNYVIQYVLDLNDNKIYSEPLIQRFLGHICTLSMQKFSSNVIEKCLRIAETSTCKDMIEELVNTTILDKLLKDSYANYVIQTALDFADAETRLRLIHNIEPIMPVIRGTPYGRRIQSKIANVTNNNQSVGPPSSHFGGGPSRHSSNNPDGSQQGSSNNNNNNNNNNGRQFLMSSHTRSDTGPDFVYHSNQHQNQNQGQNLLQHQQHHQTPQHMQHRNNHYQQPPHRQQQLHQHPHQPPQMRQFPYNY